MTGSLSLPRWRGLTGSAAIPVQLLGLTVGHEQQDHEGVLGIDTLIGWARTDSVALWLTLYALIRICLLLCTFQ